MKKNMLIELDWLKKQDREFDKIISSLKKKDVDVNFLEKINPYYINYRNSEVLSKLLSKNKEKILESGNFSTFNLGIISNLNYDFLYPALKAYALKNYIYLNCHAAPYGQTINFLKNDANVFKGKKLDAVLLALDFSSLGYSKTKNIAHNTFHYIKEIVDLVNSEFKTPCIIQNMINSSAFIYGSLDFLMEDSHRYITYEINGLLKEELKRNNYNIIFDVEKLSSMLGIDLWCDETLFYLAKIPISKTAIPAYSYYLSNIIGSIKGKSKRLLVLDLDNTLWGGVIGDIGIENVEIGQTSPLGEAYTTFQKYLLQLRERGVLLAISSKNNSASTINAINKHPEMLIKEMHLSAYEINWKDKAQNIVKICNKVKLGLQSTVFVDDNPFERNLVRNFLPSITVPELPNDPSYFKKYLSVSSYFETTFFSRDDRIRSSFFTSEKKRLDLKKHHSDINKYLETLQMKGEIRSFQKVDIKRIEQLINKSNQFNLTTKRYSFADLKEISSNKKFITFQLRLSDIYGENGIIGLIILKMNKQDIFIDTWIQSCRILERKVEFFLLDQIVNIANSKKIKTIKGKFIQTNKNQIVKEHYKKLGFVKIDKNDFCNWKLDITKYNKPIIPIKKI